VVGAVLEPAQPGGMPDLIGRSAREAVRMLSRVGATARMSGDGFVIEQWPAAGEPVRSGETGVLKLDRRPAAPAPTGGESR
jgi:beta-lactam-binding protein with PASTA domain